MQTHTHTHTPTPTHALTCYSTPHAHGTRTHSLLGNVPHSFFLPILINLLLGLIFLQLGSPSPITLHPRSIHSHLLRVFPFQTFSTQETSDPIRCSRRRWRSSRWNGPRFDSSAGRWVKWWEDCISLQHAIETMVVVWSFTRSWVWILPLSILFRENLMSYLFSVKTLRKRIEGNGPYLPCYVA